MDRSLYFIQKKNHHQGIVRNKLILILLLLGTFTLSTFGQDLDKDARIGLKFILLDNEVLNNGFSGLQLYNPKNKKVLYDLNGDKPFTPASNMKLMTLLTSLEVLGDSIPAIHYTKRNNEIIFTGTGDPSFLNPVISSDQKVYSFLKNAKEKLVYFPAPLEDEKFGSGWAWDDYAYYFQAEKSSFPIYGNLVESFFDNGQYALRPDVFPNVKVNNELTYPFDRAEEENNFEVNPTLSKGRSFYIHVPFEYSDTLFLEMLNDTLKKEVSFYQGVSKPYLNQTLYNAKADSVYKTLMHDSDNFIAEQLLLLCSAELKDTFETAIAIEYANEQLFHDLPDEFQWVDGSGLSRYNLTSPRNLVQILDKIHKKIPMERIKIIFASNGQNGELQNMLHGEDAVIFAKTGSMKNKYCLSGFIDTKRNGILIFSFMFNNYLGSSEPIVLELNRILNYIRNNY